MNSHNVLKLVTIVTEASIEKLLINELNNLGVSGYTITDARGRGGHGTREADWKTSSNIRIEIICNSDLADKILKMVYKCYYNNYAIITFLSDVNVYSHKTPLDIS